MKEISQAIHFVHIGFDKSDNFQFTSKLQNKIKEISNDINKILIFVDIPNYTQQEIKLLNYIYLAGLIVQFINIHHILSCMPTLENKIQEHLIDLIPGDILSDLYREFKGLEKLISQPVGAIQTMIKIDQEINDIIGDQNLCQEELLKFFPEDILTSTSNTHIHLKPDQIEKINLLKQTRPSRDQIKTEAAIQDSYYKNAMNNIGPILQNLWKKFKNNNISHLSVYSPDNKLDLQNIANYPRRDHLFKFALQTLGKQRVYQAYLRDGDDYEYMFNFQNNISENFEKDFGDLTDKIYKLHFNFMKKRLKWYKQFFLDQLDKNGYIINQNTLHLVGGEYAGSCVSNWAHILTELFQIPNNQIQESEDLALLKNKI